MKITLEGFEATEYLDMQRRCEEVDQIAAERNELRDLVDDKTEIIKELQALLDEAYKSPESPTCNYRVERDKELAQDLGYKPPIPFADAVEPNVEPVSTAPKPWLTWEINKVVEAMTFNTAPSRKKLAWLLGQLPDRSEAAVRSKIHSYGGKVKEGVII